MRVESSSVWVLRGREVLAGPLSPEPIAPKAGFEKPWITQLPEAIEDPLFGTQVAVPQTPEGRGRLELHSSEKHLRMSERTKPLNVVRVRNLRNILSNWSVADLAPVAASAFLYGTLACNGLGAEHVAGADRQALADLPLTRALRHWTAQRVRAAADEIRRAEAQRESEAGRERANDALRQLRELMRQFLREQPGGGGAEPTKVLGQSQDQGSLETGWMRWFSKGERLHCRPRASTGTHPPHVLRSRSRDEEAHARACARCAASRSAGRGAVEPRRHATGPAPRDR
jgi:hypothetical protein